MTIGTEEIDKYIDQEGIVVEFPETTSQKIIAVIAYAETLKHDCLLAEKQLEVAKEAITEAHIELLHSIPTTGDIFKNRAIDRLRKALAEIKRIGNSHQTKNTDESQYWEG
jgi:hypothetical protein